MAKILTLLALSAALLSGACATRGGAGGPVPQPFPTPGSRPESPVPSPAAPAGSRDGYAVTGTALSLRGVPYAGGGANPSGFDCSGFVWYVFAQHGVDVPRTVADQYRAGQSVTTTALAAGDLVFFNTKGEGATHVGIVIGGDEFVHAPSSNGVVRVERLSSPYWSSRLVGARRVL